MSTMAEVFFFFKQIKHGPPHSMESLIFHAMGVRRREPSSPSTTPIQIPTNSHRLLHQVGGSDAIF